MNIQSAARTCAPDVVQCAMGTIPAYPNIPRSPLASDAHAVYSVDDGGFILLQGTERCAAKRAAPMLLW